MNNHIILWISVLMFVACAKRVEIDREMPLAADGWTSLALGSCAHQEKDQGFWDKILKHNPEVFLFMGDNVYGDVQDHGRIAMPELGMAYARLSHSREFQRFRSEVPILPTWDDPIKALRHAAEVRDV